MKIREYLYLSGPMTGYKDKNFPSFTEAARLLRAKGYRVVNPAELDETIPKPTWEECLRRDIRAMMVCKGVATLPGWKKSKGANLETYIARQLKWPIHKYQYWVKKSRRIK